MAKKSKVMRVDGEFVIMVEDLAGILEDITGKRPETTEVTRFIARKERKTVVVPARSKRRKRGAINDMFESFVF